MSHREIPQGVAQVLYVYKEANQEEERMPDFYSRSIEIPDTLYHELQRIASLYETTVEEVVKKFFRFGLLASHHDLESLTFNWKDGEETEATMWGEEGHGTSWEDLLDR